MLENGSEQNRTGSSHDIYTRCDDRVRLPPPTSWDDGKVLAMIREEKTIMVWARSVGSACVVERKGGRRR